jgi:hypothetical protein
MITNKEREGPTKMPIDASVAAVGPSSHPLLSCTRTVRGTSRTTARSPIRGSSCLLRSHEFQDPRPLPTARVIFCVCFISSVWQASRTQPNAPPFPVEPIYPSPQPQVRNSSSLRPASGLENSKTSKRRGFISFKMLCQTRSERGQWLRRVPLLYSTEVVDEARVIRPFTVRVLVNL